MRSAAVLIMASIFGLAIYMIFGRLPKPAEAQPQTSPPAIVQPLDPFEDDYEVARNEKERRVVLVFTSEWCPHCVHLKKHLEDSRPEGFLFCFVDTKARPDLAREYKVRRLPTSVMLEKGEEASRKVGFLEEDWDAWLSSKH